MAAVDDDEIREGIRLLARTTGVFAETAGGVTVAVLRKLVESGRIDTSVETVVYNTGDGLKTIDAVSDGAPPDGRHPADAEGHARGRPALIAFVVRSARFARPRTDHPRRKPDRSRARPRSNALTTRAGAAARAAPVASSQPHRVADEAEVLERLLPVLLGGQHSPARRTSPRPSASPTTPNSSQ